MSNPLQLEASSRILYDEAVTRGIDCQGFGDRQTILMSKNGVNWYVRGSRTSLQSSVGKTIADFKPLTKLVLSHFQIPTADFVAIRTEKDLAKLATLQFPIVVKPSSGQHGRDVVVGVKTPEEVAAIWRQHPENTLLCENLLQGIEYRVVCVDFQLVAVAFRKPAHVIGDGTHTITELVAEKNQHPWRGEGHTANLTFIKIDALVEKYLSEQGLTPTSVPTAKQEVPLRKTANLSTGGEAWDVTDQVCPENKALFEKIARACDLNVIGIDIMCKNIDTPIESQERAGVIEVNASPGLRMHHFPIQGKPRDIAGAILDMVERKLLSK